MVFSSADHPRSRGVYCGLVAFFPGGAGSSPLARGLLARVSLLLLDHGIIPARAGFTKGGADKDGKWKDHPRSRGVYYDKSAGIDAPPGSSPLARGLPVGFWYLPVMNGIIPARAGFTCFQGFMTAPPADHPRSRGVYHVLSQSCL